MSRDLFTDDTIRPPSRVHYDFAGGSLDRGHNGTSSNLVPRDPEMQRIVDEINAERDTERARKEAEMNTPENRQKAIEANIAERERKKIDFHFERAIPRCLEEGWKHLREELTDEEIRVYTVDNERRRFWGIKPAGMGMFDFWEQNDPEVGRYDDMIATTWENPLIPPPVTWLDENQPVIWAGQGLNPDLTAPEPPITEAPQLAKAAAKPRKRQKTPEANPTRRVRKSNTQSPKIKKNTRNSFKVDAGHPGLGNQMREEPVAAHANGRPTRNKAAVTASSAQQKSATQDGGLTPSKRPRGRPPAKGKLAEKSPKLKKTPAVKGNARVTKSPQTDRRPSAPSTHKMRTRRKGPAEPLQLP